MKHLTTMLLALGIALGAAGQNVVVVMKDGTSHTFNADRLSEITFKDVPLETPPVEFKTVEVNPYGNGCVDVTFKTEDESVTCVAELNGTLDAAYLQPGVYNYSSTVEPYTFDPQWTKLEMDGVSKKMTGGKVTVTIEERVYSFDMEYELEGGETFRGKFSGELPDYTQWLKGTMNKASYNANPQAPGTFYVKLSDPDYTYEMALVLVADASAQVLPAGTYTYSETSAPGTLLATSNVDCNFVPRGNCHFAPGSEVVVEKNGEEYKITMHLKLEDKREAEITYTGSISGTPTFE